MNMINKFESYYNQQEMDLNKATMQRGRRRRIRTRVKNVMTADSITIEAKKVEEASIYDYLERYSFKMIIQNEEQELLINMENFLILHFDYPRKELKYVNHYCLHRAIRHLCIKA